MRHIPSIQSKSDNLKSIEIANVDTIEPKYDVVIDSSTFLGAATSSSILCQDVDFIRSESNCIISFGSCIMCMLRDISTTITHIVDDILGYRGSSFEHIHIIIN